MEELLRSWEMHTFHSTLGTDANTIDTHVNSLKKYGAGQAQLSLDVFKKMALTLHVSTDFLLFDVQEREPQGDLALQLRAITELSEREQQVIRRFWKV